MRLIKPVVVFLVLILSFLVLEESEAALIKGDIAPSFKALEKSKKRQMVIVYFFKLASKPSIKGLTYLKSLSEQYRESGIEIIAVSRDKPTDVRKFLQLNPLPFDVVNKKKIFEEYGVQFFFPTTYVLGPGKRISDIIEGGGPSSEIFITTIAQRSLQLKKTKIPKKLYTKILKKEPGNIIAQAGLANVLLAEGETEKAKEAFTRIAKSNAPNANLGKGGLVSAYLKGGELVKALGLAKEIRANDSSSGIVDFVQGDILSSQGDYDGALSSYKQATEGTFFSDVRKADAFNNLGRIYSEQGNYVEAEGMYQNAIIQNPYSSKIISNQGAIFEKQGKTRDALNAYRVAMTADPEDLVARLLEKRIMEHLSFKEDVAQQKRIDSLVTDLVKRFEEGDLSTAATSDPWTSRPMSVALLGLKSVGGGLLREGMVEILQQEIGAQMSASGRISLVEREILDKLLEELKLGSSALVDPETALRLGKLFATRLIVSGRLIQVPQGLRLSLRVIDPETAKVKITFSDVMNRRNSLLSLASNTADVLHQRIKTLYPLQGKIAMVREENQVVINIGQKHGVQAGTRMKVISEEEEIVFEGKMIGHLKKKIGFLEITKSEETISFGKLIEQNEPIKKGQKVVEDVGSLEKDF